MRPKILVRLAPLALILGASSFNGDSYTVTELCPTSSNSVGGGAVLTLEGNIAQHPERARVTSGPVGRFGVLIYGSVAANPPLPWGNGTLCIAPFHPSNGRYLVSAFSDVGELEVLMNGTAMPSSFPFYPGDSGLFQYVYRDVQGWNLSNAVMITMAP